MAKIEIDSGRVSVKDDDDRDNLEGTDLLADLIYPSENILEPNVKEDYTTAIPPLKELEDGEIPSFDSATQKRFDSGYTIDTTDDLPSNLVAKGLEIKRNIIPVYVKKDGDGKFIFQDQAGNSLDLYQNPLNTYGQAQTSERKINLTEAVFITDNGIADEFEDAYQHGSDKLKDSDRDKIKYLLNPKNKIKTIEHECKHICNYIKVAEKFGDTHPHVSPKDFVFLSFFDELSATLDPLAKELMAGSSTHAPAHNWFYDKFGRNIPDIHTDEGKINILQATIEHWKNNNTGFYSGENNQFHNKLKEIIKQNPYALYGKPNSEDFKTIRKIFLGAFGESSVIDNEAIVNAIKDMRSYIINENDSWIDEERKNLITKLEKLAELGVDENKLREMKKCVADSAHETFTTESFEYVPLPNDYNPIPEETRIFYREFFKKHFHEHDFTYTEDEDAPNFNITLKNHNNEKETVNISIDGDHNIRMTAQKPDGSKIVPPQNYFEKIVLLSKKQNHRIAFGNITTPEYAARLYLACQKFNVPISNAPDINNTEFQNALAAIKIKDLKWRLKNDEAFEYASSIQNNEETLANLLSMRDDSGKKLFRPVKKDGEIISVKAITDASGNIPEKAKEALRDYIIARRDKSIKDLTDNTVGYDHDKTDGTKKVSFYKQRADAKNR